MKKIYKYYSGETVFTMDGRNWFKLTNLDEVIPTRTPRIEEIAHDLTNV